MVYFTQQLTKKVLIKTSCYIKFSKGSFMLIFVLTFAHKDQTKVGANFEPELSLLAQFPIVLLLYLILFEQTLTTFPSISLSLSLLQTFRNAVKKFFITCANQVLFSPQNVSLSHTHTHTKCRMLNDEQTKVNNHYCRIKIKQPHLHSLLISA